jgi:hypothetical protein
VGSLGGVGKLYNFGDATIGPVDSKEEDLTGDIVQCLIPAHPEALVEVLLQVYTVQQLILVHDLVCDHLTSMPGEQDRH